MTSERRQLGDVGEEAAARYLEGLGYKIVARNYRRDSGELDLIAMDRDEYVFVEVKTRTRGGFGRPEEAVTPRKIRRMATVAEQFLQSHGAEESPWRIDVIAVLTGPTGVVSLLHIRNAVY